MKMPTTLTMAMILMAMTTSSCTNSPTSSNGSGNLISNPYFSINGSPSLDSWKINDTAWVKVVANAPPGSKALSMWLAPSVGPGPGGVARTYITGQSGKTIYTLTCWEKNFAGWYWGFASIAQFREGYQVSYRNLEMQDSTWTACTLSDTCDMLPGDTLQILFSAPSLAYTSSNAASLDTATSGVCVNQVSLTRVGL